MYAKCRKSFVNYKPFKHTIRNFCHAPYTAAVLALLCVAANCVMKAISNAALNAHKRDVKLIKAQIKFFRTYAQSNDLLVDSHSSKQKKYDIIYFFTDVTYRNNKAAHV